MEKVSLFYSGSIFHKSICHYKKSKLKYSPPTKLTNVSSQEVFLDQLEQPVEEGDREATSTFFGDGIRKVSELSSIGK